MGHRMPPRTTQQSHSAAPRRESQIEPWLAKCHRQACAAAATERRRSAGMEPVKTTRDPRISTTQGAGCQRTISPSAKGGVFSLDIPFYRTRLILLDAVASGHPADRDRKLEAARE